MPYLLRCIEKNYYILLFVQLVHAVMDATHDLFRHDIFVLVTLSAF
jgi:hypothetical protein